jgi:hypothetical protein
VLGHKSSPRVSMRNAGEKFGPATLAPERPRRCAARHLMSA